VVTAAITDALRRLLLQPEPTRGPGLAGGTFTPKLIDATVSVDGPGSEDGRGVWFGFAHRAQCCGSGARSTADGWH